MRPWLTALAILALVVPLATGLAWGRPMDAALQQQLLGLYDRYNRTIAANHLDDALALRASSVRVELASQLKTPKDREDYLATARAMVPDHLAVHHTSVNEAGDKALLIALADKKTPSGRAQNEIDISFVKEGGTWKVGALESGPGPAEIKRCKDVSYQPVSAYDTSHNVSLIGRIERVDFASDHTLVVMLSGDTDTCAFLPDRSTLQQHGLDPVALQPYRIAEITGVANLRDPQKVMVNNITVHAEQ